jgi:(S)-mandelate dehydrogenase
MWPRKLIIKGILRPDDALRAKALGVDALVITNHGGRQLDSCISPIEVLPAIRSAVGPEMTLIVDSGLRRGSDFVKARAMGADAAMSGRATLYGLAAGGKDGVTHALAILRAEIDRTLGMLGCPVLTDVSSDWVSSHGGMHHATPALQGVEC